LGTKVTIRDVARLAEVSLGSASRVINGSANVGADIRERVEKAITELGFKPNALAQSMRGATRMVGILVRDITVPAFAVFVRAAQELLHDAGYTLLITCTEDRKDREIELLNFLVRRKVDGLIATTSSEEDSDLARIRSAFPAPMVLFDREFPSTSDSVRVAHRRGIRQAMEHLIGFGHKRIALITGSKNVLPSRERIIGYKEIAKERHLPIDDNLIRSVSFEADTAFFETFKLLSQPSPPTAIILGGANLLAGSVKGIQAKKLRIPDDISIIGASDSDLASLSQPPFTIVRWDYKELGRASAQLLRDRMEAKTSYPARHITLETELVIRGSCGLPSRKE